METTEILDQKTSTLEVTEKAKTYLSTIASWAKFFAILMFIYGGLIALMALLMMVLGGFMPVSLYSSGIPAFAGILYIGLAALFFFPALYLFRFSQKIKEALLSNDAQILEVSFQNMKSYWKFIGILTIVMIALSIIIIPIAIVASVAAAF
jgi:hypothetical protein